MVEVVEPTGSEPPFIELEPVDAMNSTFKWVIHDWSTIQEEKHRSEPFTLGGFNW